MIPEHYFKIDLDQSIPLYQQIYDNLIELIDNNLLTAGDALPSERLLSDYYAVNRMTVRQAINALVDKGLLSKKPGAGTFVNERSSIPSFTPTVTGFSQRMRESGGIPSSKLLSRDLITPDPVLTNRLRLDLGEKLIMIKRLRLVNNEPLMIETSYLSYGLFPALMHEDLEGQSLYQLLESLYGMMIVEAEHTMEPTLPNAYESKHLHVGLNDPAMLVRVTAYSVDRIPVEFSKSVVRGDRCRYYLRVHTQHPIIN
ncbi:MAG: GntR family transcriptional regulator [Phototrophicaceae bacterium]